MSRIEDAIRRAQQDGAPRPDEPAEALAAEDLSSPWDFDEGADPVRRAPLPHPGARTGPATDRPRPIPVDEQSAAPDGQPGERAAEKLVTSGLVAPAAAEQYRRLAAALYHAQAERRISVVMVASALANEGKTLTATNLALTLSASYDRSVLLVDADLRRPSLHEVFQVTNEAGLTDGLRAPHEDKLDLVRVSHKLSLLTSGSPATDPMSLLTSDRMARLIEEASEAFDWVVIDTPPVGLLPDANLLAGMVDVAVLVIRAASTPFEFVQRAVDALGRERIFGVVLNRVEERAVYGGYDYSSYYPHASPAG